MRGAGLDGGAAVLRLRRVHIRRFRSVAPDTKLEFGPGAVFLLGRNGSGKSTLLDLLGCLISCDFSALRNELQPVDVEWELQLRVDRPDELSISSVKLRLITVVRVNEMPFAGMVDPADAEQRVTRSHPELGWKVTGAVVRLGGERSELALDTRFEELERSLPTASDSMRFAFSDDSDATFEPPSIGPVSRRRRTPSPFEPDLLMRLIDGCRLDYGSEESRNAVRGVQALIQLSRAQGETSIRFDEALTLFDAITAGPAAQRPGAMIESRGAEAIRSTLVPHLYGSPLVQPITVSRHPDKEPTAVVDPLLQRIIECLGAEAIEVLPRLFEQNEVGKKVWHGFDFYVMWAGDVKHRHDRLSFGQKRLLAFLWYQAVFNDSPILADELTNGMHADWVNQIVDLLDGQQAFHAIQNPLLLNMSGLGEEDSIVQGFVFCSVEATEAGRVWCWRNPTQDEARRLRSAWETGFQQLSEILLSEGLW